MSFGPLENFSRFDKHYDGPEEFIHRDDCPVSVGRRMGKISTFCMCKELDRIDRECEKEDRADEDRKYGGL